MPLLDQLSAQLDRLAEWDPGPFPVVSLYLNLQADDKGRDNFEPFLRKELSDRIATYGGRGPERDTLTRDADKIRQYLDNVDRSANGLALYPGTSDLLVSMNQRDDLGARTPGDWLAQVRQGDDWRFPGCYGQGGSACAGVRKPIAVLDEHAAAGDVAVVGTAALVAEWQSARVLRVGLTATGSTYTGVATPYVTGIRNPLPLTATRDGAVLIGDWGTGKIYRIAKRP